MDDRIQPQLVHNDVSNKIPTVQGHSIVQAGNIPSPHATEKP